MAASTALRLRALAMGLREAKGRGAGPEALAAVLALTLRHKRNKTDQLSASVDRDLHALGVRLARLDDSPEARRQLTEKSLSLALEFCQLLEHSRYSGTYTHRRDAVAVLVAAASSSQAIDARRQVR